MVLGGTLGLVFLPSEAEACISRDPMTPRMYTHHVCVCVCANVHACVWGVMRGWQTGHPSALLHVALRKPHALVREVLGLRR